MSNACCAAPEALPIRRRARRLTALAILLSRMWLAAVTRAARVGAAERRVLAGRWARRLLSLLRIEVRLSGSVPPADEPLLLVANHVSWLDSYALNAVNGARFVAKAEVLAWPVIGTIAARFGTVFIKRGCFRAAARTVGVLAEALGTGHPMAVFPEATTSDGRALRPFYPAMFQAAVRSGAWVQPVAIRYRDAAGSPTDAAAYVGDMSIADSLHRLLREPRLIVELTFCAPLDSYERDAPRAGRRGARAYRRRAGPGGGSAVAARRVGGEREQAPALHITRATSSRRCASPRSPARRCDARGRWRRGGSRAGCRGSRARGRRRWRRRRARPRW